MGDLSELLRACKQHVHTFEVKMRVNELLPLSDARQLARVIETLIGRAEQGEPRTRALVWVLGRYFVIADDGDPDFAINGLDDDIAVCNAVCGHLGYSDLKIRS